MNRQHPRYHKHLARTFALIAAALFVLAAAACFGSEDSQQAGGKVTPDRPIMEVTGAYSKIATRFYVTVTSEKEWGRIWARHTGQSDAVLSAGGTRLQVDFSRYMVVAVFQGMQPYNLGVVAQSLKEDSERVVFRFTNRWVATDARSDAHVDNPYTPFGMFILPRAQKEVVLEEAVYSAKGEPATYIVRGHANLATAKPQGAQ